MYALEYNAYTQQGAAFMDACSFCRSHSLTPSCFFELQLDTASDLAPKPSDKHTRTCECLALNVSNRMRNTYLCCRRKNNRHRRRKTVAMMRSLRSAHYFTCTLQSRNLTSCRRVHISRNNLARVQRRSICTVKAIQVRPQALLWDIFQS